MKPAEDLTGRTFGLLLVLGRAGSDKYKASTWHCRCGCGRTVVARGATMRSGDRISCGCMNGRRPRQTSKRARLVLIRQVAERRAA